MKKQNLTRKGESAKVTIALAVKFMTSTKLEAHPRVLRGKISESKSQPIGPKDT